MKTLKKALSLIMVIGMLLAMVPANAAAAQTDSRTDSMKVFETFTDFGGFSALNEDWHGFKIPYYDDSNRTYLIGAAQDTESGSKVLKKWNWGVTAYQFDEAVNSGKMHISFDLKAESGTKLTFGGYHTGINTNPSDLRDIKTDGSNPYLVYASIFRINGDDTIYIPEYAYNNTNWGDASGLVDTTWHKYDITIDFDAKTVNTDNRNLFGLCKVYRDGALLDTTYIGIDQKKNGGLKGLFMNVSNGNTVNAYLDNFAVSRYSGDDEFNAPVMKAEYDSANAKVDVVFSEAVSGSDWVNAVTVSDRNGAKVEGVSAVKIGGINGVRLTLPDGISAGNYTIKASANVKGIQSQKGIANTQSFTVSAAMNANSAHMYIDESFEVYKGGMPADFREVSYNGYSEALVAALAAEAHDGTALCMGGEGDKAIAYEFDDSIYSGRFTVEFDVKHSGGGWSFGLMDKSDFFNDPAYISYSGYNTEVNNVAYSYWNTENKAGNITDAWSTWATANTLDPSGTLANKNYYFNQWADERLASETSETPNLEWYYKRVSDMNNRRSNNTLVGNMNAADTAEFTKLYAAKGKSNLGDTELSGASIPADTWTHIKTVADLDAGKYYFYINGSATPIEVTYNQASDGKYENARFSRTYLRDTVGNYKVLGGVAGIRLQKSGDGQASFDNIKVYTDTHYNDMLDFNTNVVAKTQPGWYSNKAAAWQQSMEYFGHNGENQRATVTGASGESGDNAVKFSQGYQFYTHPFAVPVKAGNAFEVEFDLKADDETRWVLHLLDDRYMVRNADNTINTAAIFNGEKGALDGSNTKHKMEQNGVLTNKYSSSNTTGFATCSASSGTPEYAADFESANIEYKTGEWQHIKLAINPVSDSATYLTLTVNNSGGTTTANKTINYSWYASGKSRFFKYDTCGIGFAIPGALGSGGGIAIDNFKVTETAAAASAAASIKYISSDGTASDMTDVIAMPISSLQVELTAPVESADGIELYYADAAKNSANYRPGYTATLSEDKTKVNIILSEYELDRYITLNVSCKSEFADSNLSSVPTTSATFKLSGNPESNYDNVEVTELRIYEYIPARIDGAYDIPAVWAPIITSDNDAGGKQLKIVAKGINYGAPIDAMLAGIEYTTSNGSKMLSYMTVEGDGGTSVPSGVFEKELPINDGTRAFDTLKAVFWAMPDGRPFAKTASVNAK